MRGVEGLDQRGEERASTAPTGAVTRTSIDWPA